jgi:hypothetical protein
MKMKVGTSRMSSSFMRATSSALVAAHTGGQAATTTAQPCAKLSYQARAQLVCEACRKRSIRNVCTQAGNTMSFLPRNSHLGMNLHRSVADATIPQLHQVWYVLHSLHCSCFVKMHNLCLQVASTLQTVHSPQSSLLEPVPQGTPACRASSLRARKQ